MAWVTDQVLDLMPHCRVGCDQGSDLLTMIPRRFTTFRAISSTSSRLQAVVCKTSAQIYCLRYRVAVLDQVEISVPRDDFRRSTCSSALIFDFSPAILVKSLQDDAAVHSEFRCEKEAGIAFAGAKDRSCLWLVTDVFCRASVTSLTRWLTSKVSTVSLRALAFVSL